MKATPHFFGRGQRSVAYLAGAVASVCLCIYSGPLSSAESLVRENLMLPVDLDGETYKLETLIVSKTGGGRKPLAVISHGSPRGNYTNRRKTTPHRYLRAAEEFARRGYVAAIVMRREFGKSEGSWSSDYGPCENANYVSAGENSGAEILSAIKSLSGRTNVDGSRVLLVGKSAGGFGSIALSADPDASISAVINFAGGRGSQKQGEVCSEDALIEAFKTFGRTSRKPVLFLYAENDKFFPPALAKRFHSAFVSTGGRAQLRIIGPFGKDGHFLFDRALEGVKLWRKPVDDFLVENSLPTWNAAPEISYINLPPPPVLNARGRDRWQRYLKASDNKAFAVSGSEKGRFGWRTGRRTIEEAKEGALSYCKGDCRIVSINGKMVP